MIIRDYQRQAIDDTRAAFAAGHRCVLVVVPTGGGKTIVASEIIRAAVARGKRVLFLAHREELIRQSVDKLAMAGVSDVRVIRATGVLGNHDAPVTVASIGTLCRPRWAVACPPADLLIVDEAHHIVAGTWRIIVDRYPDARVVGLTATPQRGDGTPLGGVFDAMVCGPTVAQLTALGHLVPCRVYAPASQLETGEIAQSPYDAWRAHGSERAIVFCVSVDHARRVAEPFGELAAVITGESRDRAATLARFAAGELRVIVNVNVLTEGFDDPGVSTCILVRAPQHAGTYLQMVGRVLRPAPGKTQATLIDLCGSVHAHGLPSEDRTYTLDGEGISGVKRDALKQCTTCGACYLAGPPACPECGAVAVRAPASVLDVVGVAIGEVTAREARPMPFTAMVSKFESRCTVCQGRVAIGDAILWRRGDKPHHARCGKRASVEELTRWVTG